MNLCEYICISVTAEDVFLIKIVFYILRDRAIVLALFIFVYTKNELGVFSPQANYTDRAAAA
jgi:hypothetical protein